MDHRQGAPTAREVLDLLWRTEECTDASPDAMHTYLAWPSWAAATVLVPDSPRAAAAVLQVAGSPVTRLARARNRVASQGALRGALHLLPGHRVRVPRADGGRSLVGVLGEQFGRTVVAGVHLGPPRANRKPVLQLVTEEGSTVGFAKIGVSPLTDRRVLAETRALAALGPRSMGSLTVPELLASGQWRGHPYAVTSAIPTRGRRAAEGGLLAQALRDLVDAWPRHRTPLAHSAWWGVLRSEVAVLDVPDLSWLRAAVTQVERAAGEREVQFGASHGDWSPWNCAVVGQRVAAWDWERFSTDRPVGTDAAHFAVQAAARLRRKGPRVAVAEIAGRAGEVVAANGAPPEDGPLVVTLYLIERAVRFIRDDQLRAGARKGPVEDWVRPGLSMLVEDLR